MPTVQIRTNAAAPLTIYWYRLDGHGVCMHLAEPEPRSADQEANNVFKELFVFDSNLSGKPLQSRMREEYSELNVRIVEQAYRSSP